jgi:AcrR family transcriptional regulator
MKKYTVRDARSQAVREHVLDGVADLLGRGEEITFTRVAKATGVPERTIYRYFPTREELLAAVFEWSNQKIGFDGKLPVDLATTIALVRSVFPGFDRIAPVIHELLIAPEGLRARQANLSKRRRAAVNVVRQEAPQLDRAETKRVAAALQLLTSAAAWQTLRDYWDMDGEEAGETAALAIELLLLGARARANTAKRG